MPVEFDPSQPFSVIDSALSGVSPANPSVIDTALSPPATPPPVASVATEAPEFDPTQPFTAVPTGPTPTFDPKAEFQKAFSIDDLKTKTVEELDKESDFHPVDFGHQFEDQLNADPIAKQKLLDVYKLREATGRTTADEIKGAVSHPIDSAGKVIKSVGTAVKAIVGGAGQVIKNVSDSGVGGAFRLLGAASVGGKAGQAGLNEEGKRIERAQAELAAAPEAAAVGTVDLLRRGARTAVETAVKLDPTGLVEDLTGEKPFSELTNEEVATRFSNDVAGKKAISEANRGAGEMVRAIGLHADELKAAGIEVRPEVIEAMSPAMDITNLLPLGAGAKVGLITKTGGRYAVRELATAATKTQASSFIRAMNAVPDVLGKGVAATGAAVEGAGVQAARLTKWLGDVGNVAGVGSLAYGRGALGAGILAVTKAGPLALRATGKAIQNVSRVVPGAVRVGADIGAEFAKGYGHGLLFTAPFMIGADAEEREGLLGAAGLGGVARGGIRALGHGKIGARIVAEAAQEKLAESIFKEVNQSTPPETLPYGTDPRLDADSARQISKLDADPVRARQARVDAMLRTFDRETAKLDAEKPLNPAQLEKRLKLREDRIAAIPETVKVQQNLLGWAKNLFKDSGVEFYAVDDAGMMRQTGGQSGRGFTVRTGQSIAPDGTVKPLVRVFMNGDVESLPHEMLHALGEIDAPGYADFRNEVNKTLTPDQRNSFEQIYNTVHNGGLPEAQWKNRLTPEQVSNEIAAELFSRTVLGEDLSGVSPSLTKRAAIFTAGLLEKVGVPLGKLSAAQAKDFVKKGTKIKAGFSTLGLRPGTEAQALGHNFVQGLLKRAAEDKLTVASEKSALAGRTLQPGEISRKAATGTPKAKTPAAPPVASIPPIVPAAPAAPAAPTAPKPRNIRTTEAAQGDFAAQRHEQTKIDEAKAVAEKTGDPEVVKHVEEISKAVETGTPLEIEYQSVKNEGGAEAPSGRGTRRTEQENAYIAEAMGALPADVRELAQKVIVPVRWETVAGKPQLLAMSLDKVIANIHKVAKEAAAHSVEAKIPYEIRQGTLTPEAWHEVVKDFQDYADNQANGYRGDGQKLTRPTEDIGISIPAENPAHNPAVIPEAKANFLNMVQGLKIPFTARETKGAVPGNVKGQILAEINARTPQKPTVIRPGDIQKQTFKTSGRDIMEVNRLRNELAADGVPVNSLIEVTERLSTENIEKVTPRPDINLKAPVTDTIRGGFLPGKSVEQIGREILDSPTPESWQKLASEMGGLTNSAYKLGQSLTDIADVAKLRSFEAEAKAQYEAAKAAMDFDAAMPAVGKKQFFTEALETATGMSPGKHATIGRILGADWKPPFPEGSSGQLLPKSSDPRAVDSAAVRDLYTGKIFAGSTHGAALRKASDAAGTPKGEFSLSASYSNPNYEQGFVTQGGDFLTRSEAMTRVEEIGQVSPENLSDAGQFATKTNLESVGFQMHRNFLPGAKDKAFLESEIQFLPKTEAGRKLADEGFDFRRAGGPANRSIVATRGGIFSGEIESTANNKGEAYIADVNVVKADREKGVGEALYRELLTDLKSDDIKTVRGMVVSPGPLNIRKKIFGGFSKLEVNGEPATIDEAIGHTKRIPGTRETIAVEAENVITPESQFLPKKRKQAPEERIAATDYSKYDAAPSQKKEAQSTGWIFPNKTFVPLDSSFHEQYLADHAEDLNTRFGTNFKTTPDVEDRLVALNKGFVRIRGGLQGERRTSGPGGVVVEMNERYFRKHRPTLENYLLDRADSIDNLTVNLLNDKGNVKDYARVTVHELDDAERANALLGVLDDLRLRGPEGQLLPKGILDHEDFPREVRLIASGKSEGVTFNSDGSVFDPGSRKLDVVTLATTNLKMSDLTPETAAAELEKYEKLFSVEGIKPGIFKLGVGTKEGDPQASVDLNVLVDQKYRENTMKFSKDNNQEALFDFVKFEAVPTGGDGTRSVLYRPDDLLAAAKKLVKGEPVDVSGAADEGMLGGLGLASEERAKQLRVKSRVAKSRDKFPEALKLAYAKDDAGQFILGEDGKPKPRVQEYVFMDTPLAREAAKGLKGEDRVKAVAEELGRRLAIEGADALKNPEMSAGTKWYSTARTRLKGLFGDDSKFFAELLGATSARTPVEVNYRFALDAYNQFKQGKFDGIIKKYREGKLRWLNADVKDFLKANPRNTEPTRGQFLDWWVIEHDLGPTQSNGKKFGANSRQVLRVLDGSWAAETGGPKTPNFAGNLSGSTFAATVDVWAARALHRLANEGNEKPWRILPEMETGVTDEDFAIGQAAYAFAAKKLGMKPDALQAVLWFAEKDRWEREGWTRGAGAAKSDFNVLLKETEKGPGGIFKMKTAQQALDFELKPGDIVTRKK